MFNKIITDIRRLNTLDEKSTELKFLKFNEEFGEFTAAYLNQSGASFKNKDIDNLKEEMSDALQCLLSIYLDIEKKYGINVVNDILPNILNVKNKKWERKAIKKNNVNLNTSLTKFIDLNVGDVFYPIIAKKYLIYTNGVYRKWLLNNKISYTVIKKTNRYIKTVYDNNIINFCIKNKSYHFFTTKCLKSIK